jgi:nucleoside-diphosphate-sugar epimerase
VTRIAVFGGSGFVGSAIVRELRAQGHDVTELPALRLRSEAGSPDEILSAAASLGQHLADDLRGVEAVVNAAGVARAPSGDVAVLTGANALWPGVLAIAARGAGVARFVHISSAAVQGRVAQLDEELTHATDSAYSRSKALGEAALSTLGWPDCIILRPTSVHGSGRSVTRSLAALARSPLSVVEAPGTSHTPQVHVESVARAVGVLVDPGEAPPPIVLQPSEGFSVASFLTVLGCGRKPRSLPRWVSRPAISAAYAVARVGGSPVWAQARRAEMLLRGQAQVPGWLGSRADIVTPVASWQALAVECASGHAGTGGPGNLE